jgi:prepilin-type N-terminal cleavage/methylation domain-containing protein
VKQKNSQSGVTLIEILIAVSLLSLLSVGILIAMQLGLRTMDKVDARMVRNRRVTSARRIIENEISGFISTMAVSTPAPDAYIQVQFLQAGPQSMRFVSAFSLQDAWRGRPQIAALQVVPGENNEGVRLIVNETPYTGPAQAGQFIAGTETDPTGRVVTRFAPIVPGPQSFVVADRLRYCRFSYLEKRMIQPFEIWQNEWTLPQILPAGIRIEMASLDSSPADLHATTITIPLSVNRTPGTNYGEQ